MKAIYIVIGVANQGEASNEEIPIPQLDIAKVFQPSLVVSIALRKMLTTRFPFGAKSDDEAVKISDWLNHCIGIVRSVRNVQDH